MGMAGGALGKQKRKHVSSFEMKNDLNKNERKKTQLDQNGLLLSGWKKKLTL